MRLFEFFQLLRLYGAKHPIKYAARIAFGIAFRRLPF